MDDIHTFHTRSYDKSDDFEEPSLLQRVSVLIQAVPILLVKLFIIICAFIHHSIQQVFYCFVPRPLTDIRGQLAVVSAKEIGSFYIFI